jgi:two-component system, LytTR family, sensor kinase
MPADRRILLHGLVAWTGVAALFSVVLGFRRLTAGLAYYDSWIQISNNFVIFYAGALLSVPLLPLFARISAGARRLSSRIGLYAALGIAYWVTWSLLRVGLELAGVVRYVSATPPLQEHVVRSLVFMAYIGLTLYVVMVMLYEAFRHLEHVRRAEVEAAQLHSELEVAQAAALRARLNPGFVFDTFQLASELMATQVRTARRVLSDLSELLRVSLGQEGHRLVPLRDEMQLVERYLAIQRSRPGWRARVELDLSPEAASYRVPPLLLQPLLESAVQQGVGRGEGGELVVRGTRERRGLRLTLLARAPDWQAGQVLLERLADGVDLTRARLNLAFGEHAALRVSSPASGTLEVEMDIPEISEEAMHDG